MSADLLTSDWFYVKQGRSDADRVGPVSWERLVALARTGALVPADQVWHQTLPGWVPAAQVAGLFAAPVAGTPVATAPPAAPPQAAAPAAGGGGAGTPAHPVPPAPTAPAYPAAGGPAAPGYPPPPGYQAAPGYQAVRGPAAPRRSRLPWLIPLVAVVVVGIALGLVFGLKDGDDNRGLVASSTTEPTTVSTAVSTTDATTSSTEPTTTVTTIVGEPDTWLVMMYEDGDDEVLEEDILYDLNEAELVGSTDQVTIVAQLDRFVGGYDGNGDVTAAKRYLLTQDTDLYTLTSAELSDLGEVDMGDGETLYDFVTWAITSYPVEHYVLILGDHGGGWTGGWSDDDPTPDSGLDMQEIDDTLSAVIADTGIGGFELIGFDACLMGQLEVMSAVAPHAKYAVGSEETEPGIGWGYYGFLQALVTDPTMTGLQLGQAIIDSYINGDIRVTDDDARAIFAGGEYSMEEVAAELNRGSTLSAVDLSAIQEVNAAVNSLALALADVDQELVAQARAYAQSYYNIFGEDNPPSFIDLGHFAELVLQDVGDPMAAGAAQEVKNALAQAVVAETHGTDKPGSTGLSIYFPTSLVYEYTFSDPALNYPASIGRFSAASIWDDYLTYHYTGETFEAGFADLAVVTPQESTETDFTEAVDEALPETDAEIVGPGAGEVAIAPLDISASEIGPDDMATISTQITGANVAYVYYYVAYYYEDDGSFLTGDEGFIESGYVKEIDGVYYPDWGEEGVINVQWEWEPTLYFMSDGNPDNDQFAFFEPTVYGADTSTDVYTVRGTYTFVDTGTEIDAEIDFTGDGEMLSVWGFVGGSGAWTSGSWHEITPRPGDTFNITDEYLEFDVNPDGEFVDYYGGTMTFGDTPFTMVPYYAYSGLYALGIGVEDFDGNLYWEFAELTVTE